jgi:hypothetical protein
MDDFPTVADALFEIADNPLDYRHGRQLDIDVTIRKDRDQVVVEDRGGEGMDDEGIADWLKWGSGHPHQSGDIGQYHKGGKAACGYLADSIVILTRRAGHKEVWRFEDRHWKTRSNWADFGAPTPYEEAIPEHLRALPLEVGFTRLELSDLGERRYNLEKLRWMFGNTYRRLIANGHVTLRLNGEPVRALSMPLSSAFKPKDEDVRLPSGKRVHLWVGRLDRDAIKGGPARIQGGLRLLYQGRLISEGEYFGHNLGGQGQLASLIGEVDLNHVPPLSNKIGFKKSTPEWEEVEEQLNLWLAPVIIEFRRAAEEQPVSREERKRANDVRRDLTEALRDMRADANKPAPNALGDEKASGGRKPPIPRDQPATKTEWQGDHRRTPVARSIPPDEAVGVLQRLARRLKKGEEAPPIELRDLDPSVRSEAIRNGDMITKILINRLYPLYGELKGQEAYLAETALLDLLMPAVGEKTPVVDYVSQLNQCLEAWWRVSQEAVAAA